MSSVSCLLIAFVIILWNIGQHSVQAKRFNFLYDIIFELHSNSSSIQQMTLSNLDGRVGRANPHDPSKILTFDYRRPTRIFIHGFYSNRDTLDAYAKAYREAGDYNFIAINWLEGAVTLNYKRARDRVKIVGETVARFIDYLVNEYGMALSDLVLIGHSLGAHACGAAGRNVKFGSVAAIVGLDPALPCFGHRHQAERLQQSDAEHVTVIHTNGGVFGISSPLGHADFFPNFGKDQPGCGGTVIGDICSHQRVHELFIESLKSKSTTFLATPCTSFHEIYENRCTQSGPMSLMQAEEAKKLHGIFYLQTNPDAPYAMHAKGYNNTLLMG